MPDISMCKGTGCKIKDTCYRYRAIPNRYAQAWVAYYEVPTKDCLAYWPIQRGQPLAAIDCETTQPKGK